MSAYLIDETLITDKLWPLLKKYVIGKHEKDMTIKDRLSFLLLPIGEGRAFNGDIGIDTISIVSEIVSVVKTETPKFHEFLKEIIDQFGTDYEFNNHGDFEDDEDDEDEVWEDQSKLQKYIFMVLCLLTAHMLGTNINTLECLIGCMAHYRLNFDLNQVYIDREDGVIEIYERIFQSEVYLPPIIV